MNTEIVSPGKTVFIKRTEDYWGRPYVMKRHHIPDLRSVILRVVVSEVKGSEFKAKLFGNNNFEKDNQTFVFNENDLLCDQNFTDFGSLGKWSYSDIYGNKLDAKGDKIEVVQ